MNIVIPNREAKSMRKKQGKFINRKTISKGKKYDKFFIYVPTEVARDTNCPFQAGDKVTIEIKHDTLIIRKARD